MKACGFWVLLKKEEETKSGLVLIDMNRGEIICRGSVCTDDYNAGDKVWFCKRNAIEIDDYLLVKDVDIYAVIE